MRLKWTPVRLTNVPALPRQTRLDLAVQRGRHQGLLPLVLRGIDNQATVGRKTRALVCRGVGNGGNGSGCKLHHMQLEGASDTGDIRQETAIGAQAGRYVVAAAEGDPLRIAARTGNLVDLGRPTAVTDEVNATPIW